MDLKIFLATKNLTLSDRLKKLNIIRRKVLRKFGWFLMRLAYHRGSFDGGRWPCLYAFMIDRALKEATLDYILYMHKKTRFLKSHCTGYEYFKDSSIVYTDISCFDLTVECSNKNN